MRRSGSVISRRGDSRQRCWIGVLRYRPVEDRGWQDAVVVALQIHGVSEPTRRTLSAEARARGESLQEFLLDLLDREAQQIDNRQRLEVDAVDFVKLVHSEPAAERYSLPTAVHVAAAANLDDLATTSLQ